MTSPLISAAELATAVRSARPPRVLDVRWKLGGPPGPDEFARGHIPGAVYVDLDTELAGHGAPTDGRHPLPPLPVFQAAARRWGLNAGDDVVAYDDVSGTSAARLWWLLRYAGFTGTVRVLDGGLSAWVAAGGALERETVPPRPGRVELAYGSLPTLDADGAASLATDGILLDARAGERFRGEVEPIDPRAGHIPGAVSAPTTANLAPDGRHLSAEALATRFADLGVTPEARIGVYCGSGVTAAHEVLALVAAGFPEPALYPGSFSAWSNDPARPVETGG
ncbi:sulfurtransferase [Leifsonia sp. AG29]|uniref:sulfurtransferase n=1 Tax=Leifsonia sp. AG29 TaxID=2598860 RepID=UPI00131D3009|nr:sulfurtransferase [Leifsonia sp. AG29]